MSLVLARTLPVGRRCLALMRAEEGGLPLDELRLDLCALRLQLQQLLTRPLLPTLLLCRLTILLGRGVLEQPSTRRGRLSRPATAATAAARLARAVLPGWTLPGWALPGRALPRRALPGWALPRWALPRWALPRWAFPGWALPRWGMTQWALTRWAAADSLGREAE